MRVPPPDVLTTDQKVGVRVPRGAQVNDQKAPAGPGLFSCRRDMERQAAPCECGDTRYRTAAQRRRRTTMTIQRMDHVSVVVGDLEAAIAFFVELGMELEGQAPIEGRWVDRVVGLD